MGYNVLSGSITLGNSGSIEITGSFYGSLEGRVTANSTIPHGTVYSITNADTDRLITANNGTGNAFNAEEALTFSSADRKLTVRGLDGQATTTVEITGATENKLFHVRSPTNQNLIFATGSGLVGFGTNAPEYLVTISASTNPLALHGLQTVELANTSSYLAVEPSTGRLVLTSSAQGSGGGGAGGTIGSAEDGDYTDGLYTDFTTSTAIGTAVDRFNEVLKILAPSPAPALSAINENVTDGVTAKLSFGASGPISTFSSVGTAAGFSAVDRAASYAAGTSGANIRLGVYDGTTDISGLLNPDVAQSITNGHIAFSNDAFGNANEGTLKLEVNGATLHTASLAALTGRGNPASGADDNLSTDSGFTDVSVAASSFDGNGSEWYIFKHRTAAYKVDANDMRNGWNYARVIHTVGGVDRITNFVEWVVDPSGSSNNLAASNARIENISTAGSKYLSGVQYNTSAQASYKVDVENYYQNVYPASGTPISFGVTNVATPSAQAAPDIASDEDFSKLLRVTGSLVLNVDNLLSGAITANITATHPLKNTLSNAGAATTGNGFLIDNRTLASTNLIERFHDESYRKQSGSYDSQALASGNATDWTSSNHMVATGSAGHTDGLLMYNQQLRSPSASDLPNAGNFSKLINVNAGQPDYSSVSGKRTFYRKFQNTSGATIRDIKITSDKASAQIISTHDALTHNKIKVFTKIPETTGWMDISQNFVYGSTSDDAGALIDGATDNANLANTNDSIHCITFGTVGVANNDYVMVKVEADASWVGAYNTLNLQLGASDVSAPTEAPQLDDIETDASGVSDAKLSFGAANAIDDYTPATGSALGLSDFNSNVNYPESGDRLGVFSSKSNIVGDLNDDIGSNGQNYPADSFKDAYTGTLELHVNGRKVHEINLASTLNAITNDFNGNNSGFSVSAVAFSKTTDLIPDYTKPYRTGTFQIGAADQDLGFNTARVVHKRSGLSDVNTNYIEWVVDTDANALAASDVVLNNFSHADIYYQSGVRYFAAQPSASFAYRASNVYRNVYQNGTAVSYPITTNCFVNNVQIVGTGVNSLSADAASVSLPALNNGAFCEAADIHVTGNVVLDNTTSIKGGLGLFTDIDASVNSQILHPLKSNLVSSTLSKTDFMHYSGTIGSTTLAAQEYFGLETYRLQSSSYNNQTNVTDTNLSWDSQISVNDAGSYANYADGLVTANGYVISPLQIGNSGDTRNSAEGGSLQAPNGSPNYSTLTNSTRTYYRYFRNTTGLAKATFTITLYGDAYLCAKSGAFYTGALGANKNINVELRVPFDSGFTGPDDTSTDWADCIKPYAAGTQPTEDGVGVFNGGGSDLTQTVPTGGRNIPIQLQARQIRNNQYFVLKITAHKDWTGYLSRIGITY